MEKNNSLVHLYYLPFLGGVHSVARSACSDIIEVDSAVVANCESISLVIKIFYILLGFKYCILLLLDLFKDSLMLF